MQITCLFCENEFDVVPRDPLWKGRLRRTLICTKCSQEFKLRDVLQGARSNKPQVALLTKQGGVTLFLQDYDCSSEQAQTFASGFDEAWKKLPQIARTEIEMHWSSDPLGPYIWLLANREEWGGKGWATTMPDAHSINFVASVALELPEENLKSLIMHEFGHCLLVALGEPNHCIPSTDNRRLIKCERLVWDLLDGWGVDQLSAEEWIERNYDDDTVALRRRMTPITSPREQLQCVKDRLRVLRELAAFGFPSEFDRYRTALGD